jgi:heme/copper-type cytochrome/quinol oxidase subunit 2
LACCCDQRWKEAQRFSDWQVSTQGAEKAKIEALTLVTMALIAQIALGVIIGGLTIALVVIGFFVWNSRQRNERLAVGLFIAGAIIIAVLVVVVASL